MPEWHHCGATARDLGTELWHPPEPQATLWDHLSEIVRTQHFLIDPLPVFRYEG